MKTLKLCALLLLLVSGLDGCARKQAPRDASSFSYEPVAAIFNSATPASLQADPVPTGPTTCAEAGCPTLAQALAPLFDTKAEYAPSAMLARLDRHMAELRVRAVDHYVACLEEGGRVIPATLGGKIGLSPEFHCYMEYALPSDPEKSAGYEQLVFGRGDASPVYAALRIGQLDDKVSSLWVKRDVANGQLEIWRAVSRALANEGKVFFQIRLGPGDALEATAAGLNQFTGDNPYACGMQVKGDAEHLFVRGRFFPLTDAAFSRDSAACAARAQTSFCVEKAGLGVVDVNKCAAAGLSAFELGEVVPDDFESGLEPWGRSVNFDYSDLLERFRLTGLDIY